MLANLSAHDFGYLSSGQLVERTTNALRSMETLERYRGHFYNWYDTQTRLPLAPLYVSTVDSGNLAGHLLTLRPGLTALCDAPILNRRWLEGIGDTVAVLIEAIGQPSVAAVAQFEKTLASAIAARPVTLADAWVQVELLAACAADVVAHFDRQRSYRLDCQACIWARSPRAAMHRFARRPDFPRTVAGAEVDAETSTATSRAATVSRRFARWRRSTAQTCPSLRQARIDGSITEERNSLDSLHHLITLGAQRAAARMAAIDELAQQAAAFAAMDYDFLFDKVRRQLVIGYNVAQLRVDESHYDLLASEARLCNFVAIAQGKLPQESWFALGRLLTSAGGDPVLLSWSGSMFEYLMPLLVMPTYENTLLDQTYVAAVERQIEYGRQRGVPWGMSECGYNTVDVHLNYQYRAFGVPGLGPEARSGRGPGRGAVRVGARADGRSRGRVPQPATSRRRRIGRKAGFVRGDRLHAVAPAARRSRAPWSGRSWRITRA